MVPCLAINDTMPHIKSDVGTVGFGGCLGMSGFLLAVGKKVGLPVAAADVLCCCWLACCCWRQSRSERACVP